jgi:hypothetical protein
VAAGELHELGAHLLGQGPRRPVRERAPGDRSPPAAPPRLEVGVVHGDPAHDLGPLPAAGPLLDRLLEPLGLGPLRLGEQPWGSGASAVSATPTPP